MRFRFRLTPPRGHLWCLTAAALLALAACAPRPFIYVSPTATSAKADRDLRQCTMRKNRGFPRSESDTPRVIDVWPSRQVAAKTPTYIYVPPPTPPSPAAIKSAGDLGYILSCMTAKGYRYVQLNRSETTVYSKLESGLARDNFLRAVYARRYGS